MAIIICSKIKKCSKSSGVDCTGWLLASSIYTVSWCSQCAWQSKGAGIRQLLPAIATNPISNNQPSKVQPHHVSLKQALAGFGNYMF